MPALIVYLLKVNAALCLFYLAYRFALRPLTFYYLNRFFLVFGIVFSALYPLVDISALFAGHTVIRRQLTTIVPDWNTVIPVVQHQSQIINYWGLPIALFWIGVLLMTARLAVQFISLYRIHRSSEESHHFGQTFRSVKSEVNPFSFWQEIYLNPDKHTDAELRAIIQHEQVHVKQWHTLDVILAELSVVFYWFNPGVWFMKQAVKENLEFITDREILRSGVDEKVYQYSLVRVSTLKPGATIVNNFNFLTIKKRIIMMNKKRSSRANLSRYVVLPLVMLLTLIFTISKAEITPKNISVLVKKILPLHVTGRSLPPLTTIVDRDTVKPKVTKDSVRLMIVRSGNGEEKDTLVAPDGKRALKNVSFIRVNGGDIKADSSNVFILDDKGKPANLTLAKVAPGDIESIQIVKDTAVKAYSLSASRNNKVIVKLMPMTKVKGISVATTTGVKAMNNASVVKTMNLNGTYLVVARDNDASGNASRTFEGYSNLSTINVAKGDNIVKGQEIGTVTVSAGTGKPELFYTVTDGSKIIREADSENNADEEIIRSVIDLATVKNTDFKDVISLFKDNGFNLSIRVSNERGDNETIKISLKSNVKGNEAYTVYTDNKKAPKNVIMIEANKKTGAVSVSTQSK